jgi:RNA polymerase sigma-70 factor (ECF subfamily)
MADLAHPKPIAVAVPVDSAWLGELYAKYEAGLRRLIFGILRDREAADDVVQATFAKAVESAGNVPSEAIKVWLYRVAFHEAVTWKRRSEVDRRAIQKLWDSGQAQWPEHPSDPEQSLVREETVEQVREALDGLSAVQQQVVRARIYEEKTFAQIAAENDLPLGTVLTHMRRALLKLRDKMQGKG